MAFNFRRSEEQEPKNEQFSDALAAPSGPLEVCAHLGLYDDPALVLTEPSEGHRCFARSRPTLPGFDHQQAFCLRSDHIKCQFYRPVGVAATSGVNAHSVMQRTPYSLDEEDEPTPQRWPLMLAAVLGAIILLVGGGVAGAYFAGIDLGNLLATPQIAQVPTVVSQPSVDALLTTPAVIAANPVSQTENTEQAPVVISEQSTRLEGTNAPTVQQPTKEATEPTATELPTETSVPPVYSTPIPEPGGSVVSLSPKLGSAGWWQSNDKVRNHLNDSFLYAGVDNSETFVSATRFDLSEIPRGAPIRGVELRLTGLRDDRLQRNVKSTWIVQLIAENELRNLVRSDYLTLYSAPSSIILFPNLNEGDVGAGVINQWVFDESARQWLDKQLIDGAKTLLIRYQAITDDNQDSLFAWDSGLGPESKGDAPELIVNLGPSPDVAPPTVTKQVIVATLTSTPQNVLTKVASDSLATEIATITGTYTTVPFDIVTPTPLAQNVETAQAIALELGALSVVVDTPTPANEAIATANSFFATAVAQTTGTFTPVPFPYVTPVLILPSPPSENVATEAARVNLAANVPLADTKVITPLPYNAVLALYIYASPIPDNKATAQAENALATAEAQTTGTPTQLPWNAVIITRVPTPRSRNVAQGDGSTAVTAQDTTPTPTVDPAQTTQAQIADLSNKLVYRRASSKGDEIWVYDPATGATGPAAQPELFTQLQGQLGLSPDGSQYASPERDDRGGYQIVIHSDSGNRIVTSLNGASYDAAWSPRGDLIAFVNDKPGEVEIYTISPNGENLRQLTSSAGFDKHPTWSPDGQSIIFYSIRNGRRELWVMNTDGSNQRPLTNSAAEEFDPIWVR